MLCHAFRYCMRQRRNLFILLTHQRASSEKLPIASQAQRLSVPIRRVAQMRLI